MNLIWRLIGLIKRLLVLGYWLHYVINHAAQSILNSIPFADSLIHSNQLPINWLEFINWSKLRIEWIWISLMPSIYRNNVLIFLVYFLHSILIAGSIWFNSFLKLNSRSIPEFSERINQMAAMEWSKQDNKFTYSIKPSAKISWFVGMNWMN